MTAKNPFTIVEQLRQLAAVKPGSALGAYPQWFQDEYGHDPHLFMNRICTECADEIESLRSLSGRLLKRLAGD
jgi:hypothetical protein